MKVGNAVPKLGGFVSHGVLGVYKCHWQREEIHEGECAVSGKVFFTAVMVDGETYWRSSLPRRFVS